MNDTNGLRKKHFSYIFLFFQTLREDSSCFFCNFTIQLFKNLFPSLRFQQTLRFIPSLDLFWYWKNRCYFDLLCCTDILY